MSSPNAIPHPLLMIPGPIEFTDEVLQANAHPSMSHVGAPFINVFGESLEMLRKVFLTSDPASQPLVLSGSGTLGWDIVAANLIEPGEEALVLHTGYFADGFAECIETYGGKATQLQAPIGGRPTLEQIEKALKEKKYKVITITHVDTSTGVLSDPRTVCELVQRVSPETLVVVDGVCSVGAEDLEFDKWGVDVALTASQKAIGVPPGLSIVMLGKRAVQAFENRKAKPASYFASLKKWIPIMKAYESRKPAYFATPAVQLIYALNTSLKQILQTSMQERFAKHKAASKKVKDFVKAMGLEQVPNKPEESANSMTAVKLPDGIAPTDLLPKLAARDIVFAGGLLPQVKYFRIGHMGVTATDEQRGDLTKALEGLKASLAECGYEGAKH
ncbi:hypothetical protein YB2330_000888 [Saitoella coloradoensis]